MFDRILNRIRHCIHEHDYVLTLHADEEMAEENLTVFDIERGIISGSILERQKDATTAEWKYRVRGRTVDDAPVEIILKLGPTGKVIIITIYTL